jgi:hypothetical protein
MVNVVTVLAWFALPQSALSVDPPPDGGYPGLNTAEGENALFSLTGGEANTAIGFEALFHDTIGTYNTATGYRALFSNTSGYHNTATGVQALTTNTSGEQNTATGSSALASNKTGFNNTGNGVAALFGNTTGNGNTANGSFALSSNTTGGNNTASGVQALSNNNGNSNTASGSNALYSNTSGNKNIANGTNALHSNTTGNSNVASGFNALANKTTGSFNLALGDQAGVNLKTGNDNIYIANAGIAGESGTLRIGNGKTIVAYIKGIYSKTVATGVGVIIGSDGKLGTVQSSARFKEAIKPMDTASEAILALQPVTFRYKQELDPDGIPQFGLVAEEVEKVNPELVVRGEDGKVSTVRYEAVNAMLLNEFLKEHRKVQSLEAKLSQQQTQIEALTAGLQKVSAAVELNKATPSQVADNR